MTIGQRVRMVREDAKKSREAFAETIRITADQLNNIERDRLKNPSTKQALFELICNKYGVNYDWLVYGEGEKERKRTPNQELIDFMTSISKLPDDSVTRKFVYGLSTMDREELEMILKKIQSLLN